ncbi:MAG: 2-hydroxyacyl-CoA dehydratase family protein [Pseudomonadota bacterium]
MSALDKLESHLRTRVVDLAKAKKEGKKIIGYTPGGYMPEEMVYAAGAIPVGLIRGGEHIPVEIAGAYLSRWMDTFCRAQIGYKVLKEDEIYQMIDLTVVPVTDVNIRMIAEVWGFYFGTDDLFMFGVPHKKTEHARHYYIHGLNRLKNKLEEITGNEITDTRLRDAIALSNRERELLKEISLMRKSSSLPITGKQFARLNHISFLGDKATVVDLLEELKNEMKEAANPFKGPRVLLTGSTLAMGDYKMFDLIEKAGGEVVAEEFAEGLRHYWETVNLNGDLMGALADRYFMKRVPPAWFRTSYNERVEFISSLAKDFNADGAIWYQLMYRDAYDAESHYFPKLFKERTGLSTLKIESDYDEAEVGPFSTRIETFIETIRR